MEKEMRKSDWIFLLVCFFLGVMAEQSFIIKNQIGISYLIFIAVFYSVFFWRFRHFAFTHQRFGYLVLICIWLLAAGYLTHPILPFSVLNILVIPFLVLFHLVLITSPQRMKWNRMRFVIYLLTRLIDAVKYNVLFAKYFQENARGGIKESYFSYLRRVAVGAVISVPVLVIVIPLLMSADVRFKEIIGDFPKWFDLINAETTAKAVFVVLSTAVFFGVFQVLFHKKMKLTEQETKKDLFIVDGVVAMTVLVVLNLVYILFTFVQFKYFFGGNLQGDFTYAEYARKGFFELLFVTIVNLSLTVAVLTFVHSSSNVIKRMIQTLLTILVFSSTVILSSAFKRLGMYEDAYGFSFTRILAHSFMILLAVIFAYTLVKIWVEKLSLFHFYFIASLVYYAVINTVDVGQLVVDKNIDRYEKTGKVDVQYLNTMSSEGILGLITLYQKDPNIPDLERILQERKAEITLNENSSWQSFNLKRAQANKELEKLKIE